MKYSDFKGVVSSRGLWGIVQFEEYEIDGIKYYTLEVQDGFKRFACDITGEDAINFEMYYKNMCNKAIEKREPETGVVKIKPRPVEGTLDLRFIYFKLGDNSSFYFEDFEQLVFVSGAKVISKVRFKPKFSYYIEGGGVKVLSGNIESFIEASFILAPDLPRSVGGNVLFVRNKRLFGVGDSFSVEAPPKYVKYYPELELANILELQVEHGLGDTAILELWLRCYV